MKNTKWWLLGLKAWGNILISLIICFMLALFFGLDSVWVKIIVQIVDLFVFCGLIYQFFWKAGSSDSNKVELNMAEKDIYKGMKSSVITAIPYLVLWLALLCTKTAGAGNTLGEVLLVVYSFINVPLSPIINSVFFSFGGSFASISVTSIVLTLFTPIFIMAIAAVAYWLGYKQYIIMDHIIYKNVNKKS